MVLFSLIIPVYNVEKYISKCLLSCIRQKDIFPSEYEIILVDDGSPDNSIGVASAIIQNYPSYQVRVIHRENGGLSAARNTGLREAYGKYIWFIDSDDWIEENALYLLKQKLSDIGRAEILSFNHRIVYPDQKISPISESKNYSGDGFDFLKRNNFLSAWERIYQKEFLDKHRLMFCEGYLWEDAQFNIRALSVCQCHYYYGVSLYYYVRRENSITTSGISELMEKSRFFLIDSVSQFMAHRRLEANQKVIVNQKLSNILIAAIVGIKELPQSDREKYYTLYKSNKNFYLSLLRNAGMWQFKVLAFLLQCNFMFVQKALAYRMKRAIKSMEKNI